MKEIRDLKIDLLMGNQNPIVDLFREITAGIRIINCDVYRNDGLEFIYFVPTKSEDKEWEWVFYQDVENGNLWCNYTKYWSIFEYNLNLKYQEVQDLTKFLVEEALNREVGTTWLHKTSYSFRVEEALNREVGTTIVSGDFIDKGVQEALGREVGTCSALFDKEVEKALKREKLKILGI